MPRRDVEKGVVTKSAEKASRARRKSSVLVSTAPSASSEPGIISRQYREWQQSFAAPAKRRAYIRVICKKIADEFQPEKIILFGSHAYGTPTPESDLDLLVIMPFEGSPLAQAVKISRRLRLFLPVDLIVRTREQVQARLGMDDFFMRDIIERGKVMYEADHG